MHICPFLNQHNFKHKECDRFIWILLQKCDIPYLMCIGYFKMFDLLWKTFLEKKSRELKVSIRLLCSSFVYLLIVIWSIHHDLPILETMSYPPSNKIWNCFSIINMARATERYTPKSIFKDESQKHRSCKWSQEAHCEPCVVLCCISSRSSYFDNNITFKPNARIIRHLVRLVSAF